MRFGIGLLRLAVARAPAFLSFVSCPPCGLCPCLLVSLPCFSPRLFSCHCRPVQVPTATSSSTRSGPLACLWLLLAATAAGVAAAVAVVCCWPGCFCWLLLLLPVAVASGGCCCCCLPVAVVLAACDCSCCWCRCWCCCCPFFGTLSLAFFRLVSLSSAFPLSLPVLLVVFVAVCLVCSLFLVLSVSVSILSDLDLYSLARPALSLLTAPD